MQTVIDIIRKQRGEQQADMLKVHAAEVSMLESKGRNIPQQGPDGSPRGPGRGIFQYEISKGGSGASTSALNRYKRFYSDKGYGGTMPAEYAKQIKNLSNPGDPDFTELSPELQTEIFYADKEQKGKFPLDALGTDAFTLEDAWLDQHWGGKEEEREYKRDYYNKTIDGYNREEDRKIQEINDTQMMLNGKIEASKIAALDFDMNNIMEDLGQDYSPFPEKLMKEYKE
tara:strand:- start:14817 stop:15500 length:684 start_codon:yes stop_codon:yes gene_type:complete